MFNLGIPIFMLALLLLIGIALTAGIPFVGKKIETPNQYRGRKDAPFFLGIFINNYWV